MRKIQEPKKESEMKNVRRKRSKYSRMGCRECKRKKIKVWENIFYEKLCVKIITNQEFDGLLMTSFISVMKRDLYVQIAFDPVRNAFIFLQSPVNDLVDGPGRQITRTLSIMQ